MKLIKNLPKKVFKSKKSLSSSSSGTPRSVLSKEWLGEMSTTSTTSSTSTLYPQVEAIFSRVGGSDEELALLLNDTCSISLEDLEFVSSAEMKDAFDFFDQDHDGKITAEELFSVFTIIGEPRCTLDQCQRMIATVAKNGDGFVCFHDFCRMMEHHHT